ncbi:glutamate receptor 2 [Lingula anatina]|uniref:Glutamate receptor 2 n=1 Tax=Lingula anatina TaxID=7574 RepID=A0A2R2MPU6_LINAN|nr:glutamate receptor 2 [Lingula anatina]|eukprot:XP_023932260.1 glutamate receptor 2 [Lingula anatina]
MADQTALEEVLRQIPVVGMNKIGYHYLLGTLAMDELDLTKYEYGGANVTGFNLLNYSDSTLRRFLRGWRKESPAKYYGAGTNRIQLQSALLVDSVSVLANAFNYMMERNPSIFRGIFRDGVVYNNDAPGILCRSPSPFPWHLGNEIISAIKQSHVSGLSGKIVFDRTGKRKNFTLSVTDVSLKGRSKVGEWSRERGFKGPNWFDTPKKNVTHRGNGSYIITMNEEEPYVMWKKQDNGEPLVGNDRFEGYCVDLTRELAAIANFRYTIKLVDDKMYGEYNGTHWDGMIGELTRGEADMAISSLTITAQRQRVVDFSKPFMRTGVSIMIKKPEKEKPGVFSFLDPLDEKIWMSIAFAFVGVSVVMFLVCRISPLEWNNEAQNGEVIELETVFSLKNSLWFSFGAVMQQGADVFPKSLSGRLVGTVWWFFSLIIISSYTANLAAFLTIERTNPRIRSAEDLAQQTEIEYGCMEGGSTAKFFKNSQFKTYQNMWAFMTSRPGVFVKSTDEGLKKLRESKGKYAFLLESTTNDYKNQKKPCDTMMVGPNIQNKGYGVATAVGLEPENLREKINLAILQLDERGILTKLKKKWWYDKGECAQKPDSKTNPLKLNNVAGVFYILIGGLMLAMLVSLFEFLYNARKEAKRSKGSFKNAVRSKARLSIAGPGEHEGDYAEECVAPPPSYGAAQMGYIPSQTMVTFRGTERKTDTEV